MTAKDSGKRTPASGRGMKIKKGDHVVVIAGRDIGREGTVVAVFPDKQRVIVHGVNMIKKHTKANYQGARGAKDGGIINKEAMIHVSNVQLVDPESKKPARAGYRLDENQNKVRVSRPGGKDF
jgi:large subunit ribosomal protein L24